MTCPKCKKDRPEMHFKRFVDGVWHKTRLCSFCISLEAIKDWRNRKRKEGAFR